MDVRTFLDGAGERARGAFDRDRRILSFDAYLDLVRAAPYENLRSGVQRLVDAIDHFGTREVPGVAGPTRRHALWDAPFAAGRGAVFGQEHVQERFVRVLRTAAEEGRLDRLLLLHGPNGSSKSTLVETLMRGLAHYTTLPEGAAYRFQWVFPSSGEGQGLGFGGGRRERRRDSAAEEDVSYAHLEADDIAARMPCEMRDPPLLLLPREERGALLGAVLEARPPRRSLRHVLEGDLCPKCRAIFEGLLAGYHGDLRRLLRHVQVERWFVSPRYRSGAVVIPPQGSVDARARELAAGHSLAGLPAVLQHVPLVEVGGDLVDAAGGVLEFSDFLKRPIDLFKYLLHATEKGTVSVGPFLAQLDLVMLATTNELYLDAFKESPDWTSFKARMELLPVPYLLEPSKETSIYAGFASAVAPGRHLAPHVLDALARFAVLTRLHRPDPEAHEPAVRELVAGITPVEKLRLYDTGETPDRLGPEERRALLAALPALRDEHRGGPDFEGRQGASPREIRSVLAAAAADPEAVPCLTPRIVLRHLSEMLRDRSVYRFLQVEPREGYHDAPAFAREAGEFLARRALDDLQEALDLVPAGGYERRLETYVQHVVAYTQGERVRNTVSGEQEQASEDVMRSVERLLTVRDSPAAFRRNLVARIGAFGVDHPGQRPDWRSLFPEILRALREDYFAGIRARVRAAEERMLAFGTPEFERLPAEDQGLVRRALGNLESRFGYCGACSREAVVSVRTLLAE